MPSIKYVILFLVSFVTCFIVVGMILNSSSFSKALAQPTAGMYCVSSYEQLIEETEERDQLLAFIGITRTGTPLWFFANSDNFSVFYKDRNTGHYCTSPKYWGKIVESLPMDYRQDYLNDERP